MMRKLCRAPLRALLISLVSVVALSAPATAQDEGGPDGPVAQCVRGINHVRAQTVQTLNQGACQGVHAIARLDEAGADNETLVRAAGMFTSSLAETRERGVTAINTIASRCLDAFAMAEAPPPAARAVLTARDRAIGAINSQFRESAGTVRRALRRALAEHDGGPEQPGELDVINAD